MQRTLGTAVLAAFFSASVPALSQLSAVPEVVPSEVPLVIEAAFSFSEGLFGKRIAAPIRLTLHNRSNEQVTVIWDESAPIEPSGESRRVVHTSVAFISRGHPQAPTPLPPQTRTTEAIWPADRIGWLSWAGDWFISPIPIKVGQSVRLSLTWKTQQGSQRSATWSWRIIEGKTWLQRNWWWVSLLSLLFLAGLLQPVGP